ncbi:MBG domain-containing protein, partial [Secundilactobacillus silagincola]|uniref:MBG domain-containing protein n=1 Tax=Secundilactobacillus silagincola TaxID=1714681 RepID=UPI0015D50991
TLNQAGIEALQGANKNYTITSSNVAAGNLTITPDTTATVQISNGTKVYDGTTNVDTAQFKVTGPEGVTVPTLTADDFDL